MVNASADPKDVLLNGSLYAWLVRDTEDTRNHSNTHPFKDASEKSAMNPTFIWFRRAQTIKCNNFPNHSPPRPDQNHTKGTRPHIATSAGPAKAPKTSSWSCSSMTQPPSVSPTANQRLPSTCTDTSEARITWRWLGYCLNLVQPIRKIGRPPNLMDFDGFKLHFPCKTAIGLPFSDPDQLKRVAWHLFYCRGSRWSWRPWFFCQSRACSYWVTNPFSLIFNNPRKPWFSRGFIHTFGTIQWGCWIWTGGLD